MNCRKIEMSFEFNKLLAFDLSHLSLSFSYVIDWYYTL